MAVIGVIQARMSLTISMSTTLSQMMIHMHHHRLIFPNPSSNPCLNCLASFMQ